MGSEGSEGSEVSEGPVQWVLWVLGSFSQVLRKVHSTFDGGSDCVNERRQLARAVLRSSSGARIRVEPSARIRVEAAGSRYWIWIWFGSFARFVYVISDGAWDRL